MKPTRKTSNRFVSLLRLRHGSRMAALSLAGLATLHGLANAQAPSPPQFGPQPLNQLGRFFGYGSGDGYQACQPSGARLHTGAPRQNIPTVHGVNAIRPHFGGTLDQSVCHDCNPVSGILSKFIGNAGSANAGLVPQPMVIPHAFNPQFQHAPIAPGYTQGTSRMLNPMPMNRVPSRVQPQSVPSPNFTGNQPAQRSVLKQDEISPSDLPTPGKIDTEGARLDPGLRLPEPSEFDSKLNREPSADYELLDRKPAESAPSLDPMLGDTDLPAGSQDAAAEDDLLLPTELESDVPASGVNSNLPSIETDQSVPQGEGNKPQKVENSEEDEDLLSDRRFQRSESLNGYSAGSDAVGEVQSWMLSQRTPVRQASTNQTNRLNDLPSSGRLVPGAPQLPTSVAKNRRVTGNPEQANNASLQRERRLEARPMVEPNFEINSPAANPESTDPQKPHAEERSTSTIDWFSVDESNRKPVVNVGFSEASDQRSPSFIVQPSRRSSSSSVRRSPQ